MRSIVAVYALVITCNLAQAQSVDQYRMALANSRRSQEVIDKWNDAKKITRFPDRQNEPQRHGDLDPKSLAVGKVGRLFDGDWLVRSILDKENMLISNGSVDLWLASFPTDGFADRQNVRVVDWVKVTGTKQYEVISGHIATVSTIELLPADETTAKIKAEMDTAAKYRAAAERDFRSWKSKNGSSVDAKFVKFRSPMVHFEGQNGRKFHVRINLLIDADAEIVKRLAEEDAKQKKAAAAK
jgi:hypothetical protein